MLQVFLVSLCHTLCGMNLRLHRDPTYPPTKIMHMSSGYNYRTCGLCGKVMRVAVCQKKLKCTLNVFVEFIRCKKWMVVLT